jgi:selenium metabolism protein YedF
MGRGSDELGKNLLKGFIYSLTEQDVLPGKVIFYNGGVHSVIEGSDSLEDLKGLAEQGVEIYACGACLNFYELTAAVGEVTNMYRIVEMMRQAPRIVKP